MYRLDLISGIVLFALALVLFSQARGLPFWGELGPAEGFFPYVLSILLGGLSSFIFLRALIVPDKVEELKILGPKRWKFLAYVISFFTFGFVFPLVGYSLSVAGFLVFVLRLVEKQSWRATFMVTIISIVLSYLIFVRFLKIPVPEGWLTLLKNALT